MSEVSDVLFEGKSKTVYHSAEDDSYIIKFMITENFTGMAKEQTEDFLFKVKAVIEANRDLLGAIANIKV